MAGTGNSLRRGFAALVVINGCSQGAVDVFPTVADTGTAIVGVLLLLVGRVAWMCRN